MILTKNPVPAHAYTFTAAFALRALSSLNASLGGPQSLTSSTDALTYACLAHACYDLFKGHYFQRASVIAQSLWKKVTQPKADVAENAANSVSFKN